MTNPILASLLTQAEVASNLLLQPTTPPLYGFGGRGAREACAVCETQPASEEFTITRFTSEGKIEIAHCEACYTAILEAI